jgi:hypothetical protein
MRVVIADDSLLVRAVFAKLGLAPGDEAHRRAVAVLTYLSPDGRQ